MLLARPLIGTREDSFTEVYAMSNYKEY